MKTKQSIIIIALMFGIFLCGVYLGKPNSYREKRVEIVERNPSYNEHIGQESVESNPSHNEHNGQEHVDSKPSHNEHKDQGHNKTAIVPESSLQTHDPLTLDAPLPFLPNYRNPCFVNEDSKLYCLPYFFLLVSQKTGSTDLFSGLTSHPMIYRNKVKESHWWTRKRHPIQIQKGCNLTISEYMDTLTQTTGSQSKNVLQASLTNDKSGAVYHPQIFGDFSAAYLYDQLQWKRIPQNAGLAQPKLLSAHIIHHLLPKAKFIVILRHPSIRLFSDYCYYTKRSRKQPSAEDFHQKVIAGIAWIQSCVEQHSDGFCLYAIPDHIKNTIRWHPDLNWDPVVRLRASLYSEFLIDWFKVFDRKQFFIFTFEDYIKDRSSYLNEIFQFLDLEQMPQLQDMKPQLQTHCPVSVLPETRKLLDEFYKPFNIKLAKIMNDKRYLWDDVV